jgi:ribonuclease HI
MLPQLGLINPFKAIVYSDGSYRPKVGDAIWACNVILYDDELRENHYLRHGRLAYANNHLAELHAAFMGVKTALDWGALDIEINTDSQAVLYLMAGNDEARLLKDEMVAWRVARLKAWGERVTLKWQYTQSSHIGQTLHGRVDRLCKLAYDWSLPLEAA